MGAINEQGWKPTPAQKRAVEDDKGTLLVSAAAGSGKTKVLVERALQMICRADNPVSAEKLVIVTFTRAAAAELRTRLTEGLKKRISALPNDQAELKNRLKKQQLRLGRAEIGTIDSFCLSLIQKHFDKLDIPMDFSSAEESVVNLLRVQAMEETLDECYEDRDFCDFADLYGKSRSAGTTANIIFELYDFLRSIPFYHSWLERAQAMWTDGQEPLDKSWEEILKKCVREYAEEVNQYAQAIRIICEEAEESGLYNFSEKAVPFYRPLWENAERLLCYAKNDLELAIDYCNKFDFEKRVFSLKKDASPKEETYHSKCKELRAKIKKIVSDQIPQYFIERKEALEDKKVAAPMVCALCRAVKRFDVLFAQAKREKKILEFSDFEHLALSLLWDEENNKRTELSLMLGDMYDAVMVDEYQDTNELQDMIYRCLANKEQSNLFFVGDVKQSIYGFRQAEPDLFIQKSDAYAPIADYEEMDPLQRYPALIHLDRNFRSAPLVIEGINGIFNTLMCKENGGVDYKTSSGEQLVCPNPEDQYKGNCEIHFVGSESGGDENAIASYIKKAITEHKQVRDKNSGESRDCCPEDFCILLRTRKNFSIYKKALEKFGLAANVDEERKLLDSPAIKPLLCLIRLLDNPAQDVPLAGYMLSLMGGFSEDDLTILRAAMPDSRSNLYMAILPDWVDASGNDSVKLSSARKKAAVFYEELNRYRIASGSTPLYFLLGQICREKNWYAIVGAMPDGNINVEDVHTFIDYLHRSECNDASSAVRLIAALERSGRSVSGTEQTGIKKGAVSIMTVHRSKGLEFPIVVLADTNHKFNLSDSSANVIFHKKCGIGLNLRGPAGIYPTPAYTAASYCKRREMVSEEMRTLYVALTRAKDILTIFIPYKLSSKKSSLAEHIQDKMLLVESGTDKQACMNASAASDWLEYAFLHNAYSNGLWQSVERYGKRTFSEVWPVDFIEEQNDEPADVSIHSDEIAQERIDADLLHRIKTVLAWEYPNKIGTELPAKVTVTQLIHPGEKERLSRPAFMMRSGITGSEKGTAIHSFMEHIDFSQKPRDARAEAQRQLNKQLMDPEIFEKLDFSVVMPFFESEVYNRALSAEKILKEYAFLSRLPESGGLFSTDYNVSGALIQGVADLVLINRESIEIVDYKTDHLPNEEDYTLQYGDQLRIYAEIIGKQFPHKQVKKCTIYSFYLKKEIDVSLKQ